jgi:hypothetical protein
MVGDIRTDWRRQELPLTRLTRSTVAGIFALGAVFTLAAAPAYADATGDVRAAVMKVVGLSSYEMSFGTGSRRGTMDFAKPGNGHVRTATGEMIVIGSDFYVKRGNSGWMKLPASASVTAMRTFDNMGSLGRRPSNATATDLGMKSVDGESLHAYRVKDSDGHEATVYVGRDGFVHRVADGNGTGGVRLSKFNAAPPIHAPM